MRLKHTVTPYKLVIVKARSPKYQSIILKDATLDDAKAELQKLWDKSQDAYVGRIKNELNKMEYQELNEEINKTIKL